MPKKIFVGSLSLTTTQSTLLDNFSPYGQIVACQLALDANGSPSGGGEVEYTTDEAAETAAARKDGTVVDGQRITVRTR